MHILLALLGAIVTILVLINRLQQGGVDIGWLNPAKWQRRRAYRQQHDLNPAFKLEKPMEVVALYLVAVAKVDGDMSREQKQCILSLFEDTFHLSSGDASSLLAQCVHLFGRGEEVLAAPERVLQPAIDAFTPEQLASLSAMVEQVARAEGQPSEAQQTLVARIRQALPQATASDW